MKVRTLSKMLCVMLALVAFGVLAPSALQAQTFFGSLIGTVSDANGAILPDVSLKLTNIGTNEAKSMKSDAAGNFRFVNLVPAQYRLEAESAGFKRMVREPISVQVESVVRIDATMEIGAVTEVVEISTQPPLMQTESASMSQVVEGTLVQAMPLNGRNVLNLIALTAGVVPQGSSMGSTQVNQGNRTSNLGWGNFQIGGGIAGQNAIYLDGAPNNILSYSNIVALVLTQDALQEFRVDTSNVSAEFGRFGGGVVNMTTKSGANQFHGSAYEYFRNNVLNANNFFNKRQGYSRNKWNQNQFGVNVSGPVIRNKAFFFFSWENLHSLIGLTSLNTVPTQALRSGLIDKKLTFPSITPTSCYSNPTATTTQINSSCFDSASKVILNYWPLPNNTSSTNFISIPVLGGDQNQYNVRGDYSLTDNQRLFARYTYWNINDRSNNPMGNPNGYKTGGSYSRYKTQQAVVGDTITLNATSVLDVRLSYTRAYYDDTPPSEGADISTLGTGYANLTNQIQIKSWPSIGFSGTRNLFSNAMSNKVDWFQANNYSLNVSLNKMMGKHSLKAGGEIRLADNNATVFPKLSSGEYTFSNTMFTGDEWANFLLGYVATGYMGTANAVTSYNYSQGYYLTDTWQLGRRLTLSLGLRWELPGAVSEKKDRMAVMLPDVTDPVTGAYGTIALAKSNLYGDRGNENVHHNLFGPRVGFAYRATDKMVVRAGYAISYIPPDIGTVLASSSPVNSMYTTMYSSVNNSNLVPANVLSNPYPSGIVQAVGRTDPNFTKNFLKQSVAAPVPNQAYAYVQQRNFSIGYQITPSLMVDLGYAGSKGTHMPFAKYLNQLGSQYFSLGSALTGTDPTGKYSSYGQSLRPHPAYLNFNDANSATSAMAYNALQIKLEKRFGASGVLSGNYTWAKLIGNADSPNANLEAKYASSGPAAGGQGLIQDYNNLAGERSLLTFNVPNRALISYVLDLPFGKGKKYASGVHGMADKLVSGWTANGIITFQSGFPLLVFAPSNQLSKSFGAGQIRPNRVAGCNPVLSGSSQSRLTKWFDTSCFTAPANYTFGNEPRVDSQLKASGIANYDFSVLKTTTIHDKINVQFRSEFFNIFNRVQFAPPDPTVADALFGQVIAQGNQPRLVQFSLRVNF